MMRPSTVPYLLLGIVTICLAVIHPPGVAASDDEFPEELDRLSNLLRTPLSEAGAKWVCKAKQLQVCNVEGCRSQETETEARLDFLQKTYSRCDDNGCESYPMTYEQSGIFTVAQPDSRSAFLKVINDGSEYMEVATVWLDTYVFFGSCKGAD